MRNHEDEYSYHFTITYGDGMEWSESVDTRYKNKEERHYAHNEIMHQYPEAVNIRFDGVGRNY